MGGLSLNAGAGIIIFCHGEMGQGILNAVEMIIGRQERIATISISQGMSKDQANLALANAVEDVDCGEGVLVFTDLPGGTPCNLTVVKLSEKMEMIAGFSLPMVLKALLLRGKAENPRELAAKVLEHGKQHMISGEEIIHASLNK